MFNGLDISPVINDEGGKQEERLISWLFRNKSLIQITEARKQSTEELLVAIIKYNYKHQIKSNDKGVAFGGAFTFVIYEPILQWWYFLEKKTMQILKCSKFYRNLQMKYQRFLPFYQINLKYTYQKILFLNNQTKVSVNLQ